MATWATRDRAETAEARVKELEGRLTAIAAWTEWLDRLRGAGLTDSQIERTLSMIEALALIHAPLPSEAVTA